MVRDWKGSILNLCYLCILVFHNVQYLFKHNLGFLVCILDSVLTANLCPLDVAPVSW